MRHCVWLTVLGGMAAAWVPSAFAHRLKLFASVEGATITGYAYFPGGGRAKGQTVQVLDPVGQRLGEVKTSDEGEFTLKATVRCDHRLVIESPDGHRSTFLVEAADLPESLPAPASAAKGEPAKEPTVAPEQKVEPPPSAGPPSAIEQAVEKAVSRRIRPLQEQIERLEEKRRVQDILGGVGYILGLAGIAFYLLARRRKP
jgi:nickel transport protein